ncbi:hypothetical protein GCK32_018715, partial [Trichostrongylus colubriformis]
FLRKIGVHSVECVDIFSFDPQMVDFLPAPQLAVILCFPEKDGTKPLEKEYTDLKASGFSAPDDVFFMKQKIGNARESCSFEHAAETNLCSILARRFLKSGDEDAMESGYGVWDLLLCKLTRRAGCQ